MRKTLMTLAAAAVLALGASVTDASAAMGHGGGGHFGGGGAHFGGGGAHFGGGFHGGHFHNGFAGPFGFGLGVWPGYGYDWGYANCWQPERIWTRWGWRWRNVYVCY